MSARRPPLLARTLLRLLVPRRLYEPSAGDVEEQWREAGGLRRCWFWAAVVRTVVEAWQERLRPARDDERLRGDKFMRSLFYEIRHALRMIRKNPGFSFAAVLTLALGVGPTTAVFSLVNVFALKPLPYRDPSRVAFVFGQDSETGARRFSLPISD